MKLPTTIALIFSISLLSGLSSAKAENHPEKGYAETYSKCDFGYLRYDVACFTESRKLTFVNVYKPYAGKRVTLYKGFEPDEPLKIKVKKAGIVVVLVSSKDKGISVETMQSDGWVVVDRIGIFNVATKRTPELYILEKELDVGTYSFEKLEGFGIRLIRM